MIIGAGDIGMPIVHYLSTRGYLLSVIEKSEKICKRVANNADAAIFQGNGDDLEIWKNMEADKMDVLMALTNDDGTNMRACEIAKKRYGIPFVIARVRQPENLNKIKEAGADVAICPAEETRRLFLNALEKPASETLCEYTAESFKVTMVTIPPDGSVIGKNVDQAGIPENSKISSVLRNGGILFPTESLVFKGGDRVLVLGLAEQVEKAVDKLRNVEIM
jgi:trk system potassium uptake protein TrkA